MTDQRSGLSHSRRRQAGRSRGDNAGLRDGERLVQARTPWPELMRDALAGVRT